MAKKFNKHQLSKEMQAVFESRGTQTGNDVLGKMFPKANESNINYARGVVRARLKAEGKPAPVPAAGSLEVAPPRRKTPAQITAKAAADPGRVRGGMPSEFPCTAVMFNGMLMTRQAAGMSTSGSDVVFSVEDLEALARNMAMEAKVKQMQQQ